VSDPFIEQELEQSSQGFSLDFKRVVSRAIRFWYLIVLSLIIALAVAWYNTRYTRKVYPVSASILIRESQEMGGAELLYKNALIDPYRNYLNEPYIIRSYPLVERVVRDLNFYVSFYQEGYIVTSEAYSNMSIKAEWCGPKEVKQGRFLFTLLDENRYTLGEISKGDENNNTKEFQLNDSINFQGYKLCVVKIPGRNMNAQIGVPFILTIADPTRVAGSYISRLNVEWAAVGAGVINLSLVGTQPEKEIDFLNALIETYRHLDLEKKNEVAARTISFINNQIKEIKDSLRTVEYQLERFGNKSRVEDLSSEAKRLFNKIETFELQRAELLIRQNYYQYLDKYMQEENHMDQVILPSSFNINDPILGSLLTKMVDMQLEMKALVEPGASGNPLVVQRMGRINEIKRDVTEAIRSLRSTDGIKMDFLDKQLKVIDSQLDLLPASERQLISVQRNYALLENLYVFLMQKLSEASISEAANTSDIVPVNPPMRGGAISPNPTQNYTIASVLGITIPLIIFVLFELLNNKVQSKEDIEKMSTIPFL